MKYTETGFRALYKRFCAFMITDAIQSCTNGFPGESDANCILTYGYIDHEAGLTLAVLAAGYKSAKGFRFYDGNNSAHHMIRVGAVANDEFFHFDDAADRSFKERYAYKLSMLKFYDVSEEIEKTRMMAFLDGCRDSNCIDDVLVHLTREGFRTEGCWVRISGLGDHCIMGKLLNEPIQNFGVHINEWIAFVIQETKDKNIICRCDLTPPPK